MYKKHKQKTKVRDQAPTVITCTVAAHFPKFDCPVLEGDQKTKAKQLLKILKKNHPVFSTYKPLQIGINKILQQVYPQLSRRIINMAICFHTHHLNYIRAVSKATYRSSLSGKEIMELSDTDRKNAKLLWLAKKHELEQQQA